MSGVSKVKEDAFSDPGPLPGAAVDTPDGLRAQRLPLDTAAADARIG